MDSEDVTEVVNFQPTAEFITAEELVALRKNKDEPAQPSIGLKYSACSKSFLEEKAVDCAIESYKDILSKKLGARNCDFMYAIWNEELNAAVTSKLKGKFVQHMGCKIDGGIALSPEESLFLLENGCIEITNGKKPMSTEEAFAVMLKRNLSTEKYQVYLHLSQLGFIVVSHQKESNKVQGKSVHLEKSQKKRKNASPLPEDLNNKRLTFSGALSEETSGSKITNVSEGDGSVVPVEESQVMDETECGSKQQKKNELCENEEPLNLNQCESVTESLCCNGIETLKNDANTESEAKIDQIVEPLSSTCIEEMDMDSRSTDISCGGDASDLENQDEVNSRLTLQSQNSQCALTSSREEEEEVNEDNSEVMSCSSNSQSFQNGTEVSQRSLYVDDEITLLEVTKKETTPLAVIDLLSDEEGPDDAQTDPLSGSDDDIKIIKVCNGPADKEKTTQETPLNLEKIKSRKIRDCKLEETRSAPNSSPSVQFPDMFRKDNVCVSRPSLNLLPLHVRPNKEVYILDLPRQSGNQLEQAQQPERLWNSYKDMQDYQRARRQNRHSNRPNPHFRNHEAKLWHRNFKHREAGSSRDPRQNFIRNDYNSSHWDRASSRERRDIDFRDHDSPRTKEGGFRDHNVPRDQQEDVDYRDLNSSQDQKPCKRTTSPVPFGNVEQRNFPVNSFQCPQFPDSSPVNPVARPPGLNFAFGTQPVNPLNMNNFASTNMSHVISLEAPSFVAEVHRTAYSYATTMLSSMFGPAFNPSDIPHFMPFPSERGTHPFGSMRPHFSGVPNFNNFHSNFNAPVPSSEHFPVLNSRRSNNDYYRNRRPHRGNSFPCQYRNIYNKRSWNDVRTAVGGENGPSDNDTSDIEEIPINTNEFLWNVASICPLVKPGIKHAVSDVLKPLRLTQMAKLTDKNTRNEKCFPDKPSLEISFDVYLPGTNFKKSCPGVPKYRIVVVRAQDPIPRYSEIAVLQRKWNDGAVLQIAVVDNTDITFCSFNSVCLPDIVPFHD